MNVSRRRYMGEKGGSVLPNGYVRLKYIESNANQYIDTGIKSNSRFTYEITYQKTDAQNNSALFGMRQGTAYNNGPIFGFSYVSGTEGTGYYTNGNTENNTNIQNALDTNKHTYKVTPISGKQYLDDVEYNIGNNVTLSEWEGLYNIFLFSWNMRGSAASTTTHMKLYRYTVRDGDRIVQDLIPCRNPFGIVGLYDIIKSEFITCPIWSLFIAGPVVIENLQSLPFDAQIEYLKSDSTAYINTKLTHTNLSDLYCTFQYFNHINYGAVYGNYIDENHNSIRCILGDSVNEMFGVFNHKTSTSVELYNIKPNNKHASKNNSEYFIIDNVKDNMTTPYGESNDTEIALFNRNVTNTANRNIGLQVYDFVATNPSGICLYLIPVRIGQVGYMYDIISGQLFSNLGTGNFVLGSDIN